MLPWIAGLGLAGLWLGELSTGLVITATGFAILSFALLLSAWRTDRDLVRVLAAPDRRVTPFCYAGFLDSASLGIHLRLEPDEYDALRLIVPDLPARSAG